MAIVQISRITHRKGLQENLPQLAGAELGWAVDSRRLFIGNGLLEEGAPLIGNTEILTEHSDLLALAGKYTYKGAQAGYVVQTNYHPNSPVERAFQEKLDEYVSVRDFGAIGDGETDDTIAINRALFEVYCRSDNNLSRRVLHFPAGVYLVTDTILIPPHANLLGDGIDSSLILMDTKSSVFPQSVVRTADSNQNIGVAIGINGETKPTNITVSHMSFKSAHRNNVLIIERASRCLFDAVGFIGGRTEETVAAGSDSAVWVTETNVLFETSDISFNNCFFEHSSRGLRISGTSARNIAVSNSVFDTLFQGVIVGQSGAVSGTRVTQSTFDNIVAEGIYFAQTEYNVSAFNMFYNVGNDLRANCLIPEHSVIRFEKDNNVSYGDLFQRTSKHESLVPIVDIGKTKSFSFESTNKIQLGVFNRHVGKTITVPTVDNANDEIEDLFSFPVSSSTTGAITIDYVVRYVDNTGVRTGKIIITNNSTLTPNFDDEYLENSNLGFEFKVSKGLEEIISCDDSSISGFMDQIVVGCKITVNNDKERVLNYSITSLY